MGRAVLQNLSELPVKGGFTTTIEEAAKYLLTLEEDILNCYLDIIITHLWGCLPSPVLITPDNIHSHYVKSVHQVLGKVTLEGSFKRQLKGLLVPIVNLEECELTWLAAKIFHRAAFKLEAYYLRCLREPYLVLADLCLSTISAEEGEWDTLNFKQSVHYVGGSVMLSVLRAARLHNKTRVWVEIAKCVKDRLCSGDSVLGPDKEICSWPRQRDLFLVRGKR